MILSLAACTKSGDDNTGKTDDQTTQAPDNSQQNETTKKPDPTPTDVPAVKIEDKDEIEILTGGQLVNGKFPETKHITVEVYDRDGGTPANDNMYTDYIKKGMLEKYNVEVEFVAVPRWTEVEQINNLLAANDAPDICYSYSYATVQAYDDMGGILDMQEYLTEEYKGLFSNLWNWLGSAGINFHKEPATGKIIAIEGKRSETERIVTFVRQDWLDALNLKAPTTTQEFEDMLVAFKNNASTLLGANANEMICYAVTEDVGWTASNLIESKRDPDISDKDQYVYGYDDRGLTMPGTKEAVKILNKWYNMGLLWNDFALYSSGDSDVLDNKLKAGYVGAYTQNYDMVFRSGEDGINYQLSQLVGPNAKFVAIDPFEDSKGTHTKYLYSAVGSDRKIFFPATNTEPLACMLYLDFISDPAIVEYLQIGDEGVAHTKDANGVVTIITPDEAHAAAIPNSGKNIDLTMTTNGLRLASEDLTIKSRAYGYANVDPADVVNAINIALHDAKFPTSVDLGTVDAEVGIGDSLTAIQRSTFDKAVSASEADFDSVWESGIADYMAAGGQAIIDERKQKWEDAYGSATMLP
ncbi:MAG: sugar ABC transporter substrate-binding protein [Lachnospiraceae bacterium]|nr:sugar ABC transporter substrate-binding protein [Lachnospiraceae bacterium]